MFCTNCGTEMSDDARFCPNCGTDKLGENTSPNNKRKENDNTVKFQLKPKFNWGYKIITTGLSALLWVLIIALWLSESLVQLLLLFPALPVIVLTITVAYVAIKFIFEKLQYDALEYNFYATKVEYKDGFLNKEEKELKYKYIREVTMNKSILERIFNIGTIRIFTNASSGTTYNSKHNKMYGKNGLAIHCIKDVKEQYQKIKNIIDEGTENED